MRTLDLVHVEIEDLNGVAINVVPQEQLGVSIPEHTYISREHAQYSGETEVTPRAFNEVTLETKDKVVKSNITVKSVPYYETSNTYGTTVYIAKE